MTIVKRNGGLFPSLFHNFFENEWNADTGLTTSFANQPAVNIKETEEEFQIQLATPGIKKEDIEVQIENGNLVVSASTSNERKEEGDQFKRREFYSTSFKQSFALGDSINQEKIDADYVDGVITISLPKKTKDEKSFIQKVKLR